MDCGIFLDQGSNLCLLHCQVDSLPLSHQRSLKELLCVVQEDARGLSEARVLFPSLLRFHTYRGRLWISDLGDSPPPPTSLLAGCAEPLGLKDNTIPNEQITASSYYKTWGLSAFSWFPYYARLDNQGKFNAWTAQTDSASEWLQVGQAPPGMQGWGWVGL